MVRRTISSPVGTSYEELRAAHRLDVPSRFNMGVACADDPPRGSVAMHVTDETGPHRLLFGDISDRSSRLAAGFRELGIMRGDRVGIVLPQRWETVVAHLAIYKMGAIAVPLSRRFGPDALAHRLLDCEAVAVVVDDATAVPVAEAAPDARLIHVTQGSTSVVNLIRYHQAMRPVDTHADDPALLIYTSGTTGPPKGALHAHRTLLGHLPSVELYFNWFPTDEDVCWTPADWAWIGGLMDLVMPSLYHGRPVVGSVTDRFDPADAVATLRTNRVTCAFVPPTALRMIRASGVDTSGLHLRAVFTGGEALGAETHAWAEEALGVKVNEGYGQTELNICVGNAHLSWPIRPGSMGRAYPGFDVAILDGDGMPVSHGETGRIAIRRGHPIEMLRYWEDEDATAGKYDGEWLITGDLGRSDDDGYLTFVSREDDVITTSGYRVGPAEIEECLMTDPAVALAAVVGVPDEVRGEIIKAYIVTRSPDQATDDTAQRLADLAKRRLAPHLAPRRIAFVTELPMTATGKIKRRELRGG